jgi:hypothetical protein
MKNDTETEKDYMSQDFFNELMSEHAASEKAFIDNQNRINVRLIKALLNVKGFAFTAALLKDFVESECSGNISFCNKPRGQAESDYWGASKGVYVEQHSSMEDSYWGYIYFPIKEGKYLKCHFDC